MAEPQATRRQSPAIGESERPLAADADIDQQGLPTTEKVAYSD